MEIDLTINEKSIPAETISAISVSIKESFGPQFPAQNFPQRINSKTNATLVIAENEGEVVGFKLGFEKHFGTYKS